MSAAQYDITIEQGATFQLSLLWKDSNGVPVNLTGYTARMQVRTTHNAPDPPLVSITDTAGITLGGVAGTVGLRIEAAVTATLPAQKNCVYDLELQAADGTVTRLVEGHAFIDPEVTK